MDGAGSFNRIFVLESRASVKQTLGQILYFPLIFFIFGLIVGKYLVQQLKGLVTLVTHHVMSRYCEALLKGTVSHCPAVLKGQGQHSVTSCLKDYFRSC